MKPICRFISTALAIAAICAGALACFPKKSAETWKTSPVTRGDLSMEVTASGTVTPKTIISVGTQVSGTVAALYADFNSRVRKGQLIAILDTTMLHASVVEAQAAYDRSRIQSELAEKTLRRITALVDKSLAGTAEQDAALADRDLSLAALTASAASRDRAQINLRYARILSPIDGVVINRAVDVGQTVAASLSAPTIFTIADDLSRMQVEAGIDEADIGQVAAGQSVNFTVDAWPDKKFFGTVTQKRLQPTVAQNVVSYTVIVDADNRELLLMPGMTANITITIKTLSNVLLVPASALSFRPEAKTADHKLNRSAEGKEKSEHSMHPDSIKRGGREGRDKSGDSKDSISKRGRIFVLENGRPAFRSVRILMSSNGQTAIESELPESTLVITGNTASAKKLETNKASVSSMGPFGGPPHGR